MTPDLLPILTTLIGTGGFTVGMYSFIDPTAAARIYGMPVETSRPSFTSILASDSAARNPRSLSVSQPSSQDLHFVHALGIRNFVSGLSIITLTVYWQFFLPSGGASFDVRVAVQHALGIVILVGSFVPLTDAWVCWQHSQNVYSGHRAERETKPKNEKLEILNDQSGKPESCNESEWQHEAYETGRKAGNLHAARSFIWVLGGFWCLFK